MSLFKPQSPQVSLEELAGVTAEEPELVYYGILSPTLFQPGIEEPELQEQWTIRFPDPANPDKPAQIRVRMSQQYGETKYTTAIKSAVASDNAGAAIGARNETPETIGKDFFEHFKKLSPVGMRKLRYRMTASLGGFLEIDVPVDELGNLRSDKRGNVWVKIDYELRPGQSHEVPMIPEFITGGFWQHLRTPEQEEITRKVYDECFLLVNKVG
jgi:hypothetical protein